MIERDGYPTGVPCWIDTEQPDPAAAVDFYRGLFGWELEDAMPPDQPGHYFIARLRGGRVTAIGSLREGAPRQARWNTYVWVDDADTTMAAVARAGGTATMPASDAGQAGRLAEFTAPDGASLRLWQARGNRGAQRVNEPNTWVSSDLNTRDPEAARRFYGDVFGWQADPVDFGTGGGGSFMWRRPGYADFLETIDPGVRERHAQGGAPPGFTDSIGWMQRMTADEYPASVPAHWAITFSVADTDAAVKRAQELGATVLVPPFDAPWVRMATIRDPQGAVSSLSTYTPPATSG